MLTTQNTREPQHFENDILWTEISGNFQSLEFFRIVNAYVIDDATNKKHDLFSSKFVDVGNGIIYDNVMGLLWLKNASYFKKGMLWVDAINACEDSQYSGFLGWRAPTEKEMQRMYSVYHNHEPHPFENVDGGNYSGGWTSGYYTNARRRNVALGPRVVGKEYLSKKMHIWPVRGNSLFR